ncbi:dihydrofolate reductase family protein [Candidatus Latescibacterota bacterium]
MAEIILYIAASLDGFIAREDGGIDWLAIADSSDTVYGYADFYRSVDALVMGSRTYEQIVDMGDWPYTGKISYILTKRKLNSIRDDVIITSSQPDKVVSEIEAQNFRRIWLVGGAELTSSFRKSGLVTEYIISIIPVILGNGIPLFLPGCPDEELLHVESCNYPSGVVQVTYRRKYDT